MGSVKDEVEAFEQRQREQKQQERLRRDQEHRQKDDRFRNAPAQVVRRNDGNATELEWVRISKHTDGKSSSSGAGFVLLLAWPLMAWMMFFLVQSLRREDMGWLWAIVVVRNFQLPTSKPSANSAPIPA